MAECLPNIGPGLDPIATKQMNKSVLGEMETERIWEMLLLGFLACPSKCGSQLFKDTASALC